jgi:REP-associated tyrosine transposase
MKPATSKHRRSIRLDRRDYSFPGTYFVTICTHKRRSIFGRITNAKLIPNRLCQLVRECWVAIPLHFPQITLHESVVMPNHVHGLVAITRRVIVSTDIAPLSTFIASTPVVGAQHCCALPPGDLGQAAVTPRSLGAIVRSFKSIVARRAREELGWKGPVWQRNYFERVLRDGKEFSDASRYIAENPKKWEWDRENPKRKAH